VCIQAILDRRRGHVLASGGLEQFLLAPGDPELAIGAQLTQVAGVKVAIVAALGIQVGLLVVTDQLRAT
jgi:hypothetical protein